MENINLYALQSCYSERVKQKKKREKYLNGCQRKWRKVDILYLQNITTVTVTIFPWDWVEFVGRVPLS